MTVREVQHGLEGVVAFETTIAEPDREGGSLRYRGVDIEDLVGTYDYGKVWGLLVDGAFEPGLPPAEPFPIPVHSGDIRVDVQSALAMLAPFWGMRQILDIDAAQLREDLAMIEPRLVPLASARTYKPYKQAICCRLLIMGFASFLISHAGPNLPQRP